VLHIFFECIAYLQVWHKLLNWLGVYTTLHNNAVSKFYHLTDLYGSGRMYTEIFSVVWFSCIWVLWKIHNEKIFKDKERPTEQLVEEIIILAWK
jgi:hypothetical protein